MMNTTLEPRLQKLVDMGESGTDILHGELKNLMLEAENDYIEIETDEREGGYSDAMLSMERTRATPCLCLVTKKHKIFPKCAVN